MSERFVAVGLLTQEHLNQLGPTLKQIWPIDGTPCFAGLLEAIDECEHEVWRERASAEPQL